MTQSFSFVLKSSIIPLLFLLIVHVRPIPATTPPDSSIISIRVPDHEYSWCGGCINETCWDTITLDFFTLAIANLNTESHRLEQVNVTFSGTHETNRTGFLYQIILANVSDLPVTLHPLRYWAYNFTTIPRCTYKTSLQVLVDATLIDFGVISEGVPSLSLRTLWTDVSDYHVPPQATPAFTMEFLIFGFLVLSNIPRRKKREE